MTVTHVQDQQMVVNDVQDGKVKVFKANRWTVVLLLPFTIVFGMVFFFLIWSLFQSVEFGPLFFTPIFGAMIVACIYGILFSLNGELVLGDEYFEVWGLRKSKKIKLSDVTRIEWGLDTDNRGLVVRTKNRKVGINPNQYQTSDEGESIITYFRENVDKGLQKGFEHT